MIDKASPETPHQDKQWNGTDRETGLVIILERWATYKREALILLIQFIDHTAFK